MGKQMKVLNVESLLGRKKELVTISVTIVFCRIYASKNS